MTNQPEQVNADDDRNANAHLRVKDLEEDELDETRMSGVMGGATARTDTTLSPSLLTAWNEGIEQADQSDVTR